jgi:opacity protein-like surface antigen
MKSIALGGAVLALMSGQAFAQSNDWTYNATLYGWLPAMSTSAGTSFGTLESDVSGSDALSALDMAFMGAINASNGKWSVFGDLLYTDLSAKKPTPFGKLFSDATVEVKLTALTGYLAYRVYDKSGVAIDLGGGFRAFDVDLGLSLSKGRASSRSSSENASWVDPLLMARVHVPFNEKWFGNALVDFGGVSSDSQTWQALATVGYKFNENWSSQLGYRYMEIDHDIGKTPTMIDLSGPFIAVSYNF